MVEWPSKKRRSKIFYEELGFSRRPDVDQWGDITGWAFVLDLDGTKAGAGS